MVLDVLRQHAAHIGDQAAAIGLALAERDTLDPDLAAQLLIVLGAVTIALTKVQLHLPPGKPVDERSAKEPTLDPNAGGPPFLGRPGAS